MIPHNMKGQDLIRATDFNFLMVLGKGKLNFFIVKIILLFTKEILVGIGQDELVSGYAYEYNLVFTPALFFFGVFDAQRQFLNSLKRNQVIFVI